MECRIFFYIILRICCFCLEHKCKAREKGDALIHEKMTVEDVKTNYEMAELRATNTKLECSLMVAVANVGLKQCFQSLNVQVQRELKGENE